jgi:DNA helicase II / ATP-dependent DNA helicase PcrA
VHYLDELNDIQRQAVTEFEGPVMINAGPGSGKTRVLTYRIAFMMEQGVQPYNILALTFTNKASKEMRERIEKLIGNEARNLFMGTFHSVFARILRTKASMLGYTNNFSIYDSDDTKSVIKAIVKELGLNEDLYKANYCYSRISNLKNNLINHKIYARNEELIAEDIEANRPRMGDVFKAYTEKCFQNNAMDFDDLQLKFYELIVRFPEVLYEFQHKFQFIMVDEFQDTNFAQYSIVKKLGDVYQNICVVGDDSQSIYAFRGASIDNILSFQKDYTDTKIFKLEQNYRSTQTIVDAANFIIKKNQHQLEKTIWTENGQGNKITVLKTFSDNDEGKQIVEDIFQLAMTKQISYADIAILYRTNSQSRAFEESLRRKNIPYIIYGGISFYQRKEVKDLIAYLKLIVNPYDEEALKRVINYPLRGIGDTTIQKMTLYAAANGQKLWDVIENIDKNNVITGRTKESIEKFYMMVKSAQVQTEKNAHEISTEIAKASGLLGDLYADKSVEGLSRYENLQSLLNSIKEFVENDVIDEENPEAGMAELMADKSLGSFLQSVSLLTDKDTQTEDKPSIKLMTIHASKGLEYKAIYLVGVEENLFPSQRSIYTVEDLEEERRLFYVAVTRAESHLMISYAMSRYKFGQINPCEPSRFLKDLPEDIIEIKGGTAANNSFTNTFEKKSVLYQPNALLANLKQAAVASSIDTSNFVADSSDKMETGMKIQHVQFGFGQITEITGEGDKRIATIEFGNDQVKKIMLKYAKLKIV